MSKSSKISLGVITMLVLAHALIVRPYYMHWGTTKSETNMALPGDSLINKLCVVSTRAITIQAPPSCIWPWLLQLGQGRGGYYTYEWLENLFATEMKNADSIVPALQKVKVGDSIYFHRAMPPAQVAMIIPGKTFVLTGGWTFSLQPVSANTTRLIVRYPSFPLINTLDKLYYYPIFEPAHFIMESGMMMGIKGRSEDLYYRTERLTVKG
jgi:hypothetical protein